MRQLHISLARELTSVIVGSLLSFTIASPATAQPPTEYVFGNFCSTCMQIGSRNQLYDDGLHNDGAANDGIWGVDITTDQPAGQYSFWYAVNPRAQTDYPRTYACPPTLGASLWTTWPGDVVHFRLGGPHTNPPGNQMFEIWFPDYAMSTDHATPPGASISFHLNNPTAPSGYYLVPATRHGNVWLAEWRMPNGLGSLSGTYWVDVMPGLRFAYSYNAGCFYSNEDPTAYWRADAGGPTWFAFDETTGQYLSTKLAPTPVQHSSWGTLKAHYR